MMISGVVKNFSLSVCDGIFLKLDSAVNVRKRDRQFDRLQLDNVALAPRISEDWLSMRIGSTAAPSATGRLRSCASPSTRIATTRRSSAKRSVPVLTPVVCVLVSSTLGADGDGLPDTWLGPPGCAPRGFAARIRITRVSDGRVAKRLTTGSDGRFTVRLRPARYRVNAAPASGGQLPRCPGPVKATVRRGRYARVTIDCDTGIR